MLSITKDLEATNGIKMSLHPDYVFLTKENVEESYKKLIDKATPIIVSDGKYHLMISYPFKLVDSEGNFIKVSGEIIRRVGKNYFIIYDKKKYKVMDSNGNIIASELEADFLGCIVSFRDFKNDQDLIVTPDALITMPLYSANITGDLDNGYFFIYDIEEDIYLAYDSFGNFLNKVTDLNKAINEYKFYQNKRNRELISESSLYEKVIINGFRKYPELENYNASNLLDMLIKAASLDRDFYIDLKSSKVYSCNFVPLIRLSDGKKYIWIPDTEDERKVMEDFCLKRSKNNNE